MEVIIKTTYNGEKEKTYIDGVLSIQNAGDGVVAIVKSDITLYITLDGYTKILLK